MAGKKAPMKGDKKSSGKGDKKPPFPKGNEKAGPLAKGSGMGPFKNMNPYA